MEKCQHRGVWIRIRSFKMHGSGSGLSWDVGSGLSWVPACLPADFVHCCSRLSISDQIRKPGVGRRVARRLWQPWTTVGQSRQVDRPRLYRTQGGSPTPGPEFRNIKKRQQKMQDGHVLHILEITSEGIINLGYVYSPVSMASLNILKTSVR